MFAMRSSVVRSVIICILMHFREDLRCTDSLYSKFVGYNLKILHRRHLRNF